MMMLDYIAVMVFLPYFLMHGTFFIVTLHKVTNNSSMHPNVACVSCRCHMHAFALVMKSLLAHMHTKELTSKAQRIVTLYGSSTSIRDELKREALKDGVTKFLESSNKTRFTSVYAMAKSVLRFRSTFRRLILEAHSTFLKGSAAQQEVRDIIMSADFWDGLAEMVHLLEPFADVIDKIQAPTATLADVYRFWLVLTKKVKESLQLIQNRGACQSLLVALCSYNTCAYCVSVWLA